MRKRKPKPPCDFCGAPSFWSYAEKDSKHACMDCLANGEVHPRELTPGEVALFGPDLWRHAGLYWEAWRRVTHRD